ncbi:extradiol dioxygenase [Capsulimonas corticalis]|uniref:Extradiol dioxygenase n=1 Tax=Capsulimonas corticalis TaxID=2219043 RepID=A0A402CUW2_9BACT|nr:hypothetical protein [Capsulimonas corticalis]BDI29111.1 extradiol dioxygenase [Capsulimonas corticalis]
MPIVYACISPHGGNMLLPLDGPTPLPQTRIAMQKMRRDFEAARPDTIAILTPHGIVMEDSISIGVTAMGAGELDDLSVTAHIDRDLASAWAYHASELGVPVTPLVMQDPEAPLPLDWGVTIPLALLDPNQRLPIAVACPSTGVSRDQLIAWGDALVTASEDQDRRVALIVSADQGHGHAADGRYGFAPESAQYDRAMADAVRADDLSRLLEWDDAWIGAALADSYWQTLSLLGVQRRVPLKSRFLSYEVDHYFGLLCASYTL